MQLYWLRPEEVSNLGMVYVTRCRTFMIVRAPATDEYKLSYWGMQKFTHVGCFPQLKAAKRAAEDHQDLCGA